MEQPKSEPLYQQPRVEVTIFDDKYPAGAFTRRVDPEELKTQLAQIISERLRWCDYCNDEVTDKYLSDIDDLTRSAVNETLSLFFPVVNQKEDQNERETVEEQE